MTHFPLDLPRELSAPAIARQALTEEILAQGVSDRAEELEAAMLVVSELVTNAVLHGSSPISLTATLEDSVILTIDVRDGGEALPETDRAGGADTPGGWGLNLVDQLAQKWGVTIDVDGPGKSVWAQVALPKA